MNFLYLLQSLCSLQSFRTENRKNITLENIQHSDFVDIPNFECVQTDGDARFSLSIFFCHASSHNRAPPSLSYMFLEPIHHWLCIRREYYYKAFIIRHASVILFSASIEFRTTFFLSFFTSGPLRKRYREIL